MADINVTPMVDVMLVLLIIFMVTSPMMTSGVNVDLPKTDAKPVNSDTKPITVSIKADGGLYLGDDPVTPDQLVGQLKAASNNDPTHRIFVRGDAISIMGVSCRSWGRSRREGSRMWLCWRSSLLAPATRPASGAQRLRECPWHGHGGLIRFCSVARFIRRARCMWR